MFAPQIQNPCNAEILILHKDILIDYSEQPKFKKIRNLKNGTTIRSCLYVENDNSFGDEIASYKVLKKKKVDIHKLKIIDQKGS